MTTDLQRAVSALGALRIARGVYAYEASDEGAPRWYAVDATDMREYGRMLRLEAPDAYSVWCTETFSTRLGRADDWDPVPKLRRRYAARWG